MVFYRFSICHSYRFWLSLPTIQLSLLLWVWSSLWIDLLSPLLCSCYLILIVVQWWYQCWFSAMVLKIFSTGEVLLLFLCLIPCSVNTSSILEHTSWCHSVSLATNSSSWLTQAFFVVLNVLCLLVHDSLVRFALESSSYLEYRFFLPYIPLSCLLMLDCLLFPIPSELLILLCYSSKFSPIV